MPNHLFWRRLIIFASGLLLGGLVLGGIMMPRTAFTQSTTPQEGTARPVIPAAVSCASLGSVDLSRLDTVIASATDATEGGHAYCDVKGYISPETKFEVLLPEKTWRGDYLQQGCGGFCGHIDVSLTDPSRTSG